MERRRRRRRRRARLRVRGGERRGGGEEEEGEGVGGRRGRGRGRGRRRRVEKRRAARIWIGDLTPSSACGRLKVVDDERLRRPVDLSGRRWAGGREGPGRVVGTSTRRYTCVVPVDGTVVCTHSPVSYSVPVLHYVAKAEVRYCTYSTYIQYIHTALPNWPRAELFRDPVRIKPSPVTARGCWACFS